MAFGACITVSTRFVDNGKLNIGSFLKRFRKSVELEFFPCVSTDSNAVEIDDKEIGFAFRKRLLPFMRAPIKHLEGSTGKEVLEDRVTPHPLHDRQGADDEGAEVLMLLHQPVGGPKRG